MTFLKKKIFTGIFFHSTFSKVCSYGYIWQNRRICAGNSSVQEATSHYLIQGWLSLLKQIPLIPCLFYILSNTFWTLKHFEHIFNIWGVTNVKKKFIKCNSKCVRNVLIWPLFLEWRALEASVICQNWTSYMACSKIILGRGSANERQHYFMMPSLIGRAHTQNNLWCLQGGGQGLNIFRVWQWWVTLINLMSFSHNTEGVVMFKRLKFGTWKYDKQVVTEFIPGSFCLPIKCSWKCWYSFNQLLSIELVQNPEIKSIWTWLFRYNSIVQTVTLDMYKISIRKSILKGI